MVNRISLGAVAAVFLLTYGVAGAPLPAYEVGQRAQEEIRTPHALVVVDAEATAALKHRESQRVAAIYRYLPHAISEVEAAFRSTFNRTRSNFLDAAEARFGARTPDLDAIGASDLQRFVSGFQRQNVLCPVGPQLARVWLKGEPDSDLEKQLTAPLRSAMKHYVRPDSGPPDIWVGSTIRLISAAENETVTAALVDERGMNVPKTNFTSVSRAKSELVASFPAEERTMARYVASFIKPNCEMEADLTRDLREARTSGLLIADRFEPGAIVVRKGQEIDAKTKAALDQLQEKLLTEHARKSAVAIPASAATSPDWMPWAWAGGGAAAILVVLALFRRSGRQPVTLLPAVPTALTTLPPAETATEQAWRERALQAEQQAAKAQAVVRSGLMAQLAGWMSSRFAQRLVNQRAEMVDAHHRAAVEVAELEARLEKVQAPLQERLTAYETRIAELEKELSAKDAENRHLIQAKIQVIQKQLEIERDKHRLEFN